MSAIDLPKRLLHWYSDFVAVAVLILICSGGLVTSHEAGMAVPDWPNSFGYNMFLFPVSKWIGGIFYEHTHRLIASTVGLLTLVLCAVTLMIEERPWVKWMSGIAVLAVVTQGVLGGLRVTEHNPVLGLFHACLAQSFFALVATIALVTSRFWKAIASVEPGDSILRKSRISAIALTVAIFVQLALGAAMRHSHAGLSIPDFPTVYGGLFPPTTSDAIAKINAVRSPTQQPITAGLIWLQYIHRFLALCISIEVIRSATRLLRQPHLPGPIQFAATGWIGLVTVQVALGAWTVWSNKAADVATAHVLVGALTLVTGVLLSVSLSRLLWRATTPVGDIDHIAVSRA
jgi:heme a synthase